MKVYAGFTLLELLITLSIVGILMGVGLVTLRPPAAYLFANDLKAMILQARFEAIKRNTPVAVVWSGTDQAYTTRLDANNTNFANPATACTSISPTILSVKRTSEYRNVSVTTNMSGSGIVWLPTGLNRSCSSGIGNSTTTIRDGRASYKVIVSTTGRVKLENGS